MHEGQVPTYSRLLQQPRSAQAALLRPTNLRRLHTHTRPTPTTDCRSQINEFNFYPEDYRSTITEPAAVEPGATVGPSLGGRVLQSPPTKTKHAPLPLLH